jgi:Tfp pilus assembly protein PilO
LPTQSFRRYAKTIEPLIKKPQNRVYTTTILSFLVVSLFLWYAIRPTVRTILSLRREIADNVKISKSMEEKISMLVQAQAIYQKEIDRLPLVSQAVPNTSTPLQALTTIRDLALQSGATVSGIQLTTARLTNPVATSGASLTNPKPEKTTFSITIDGQYENIKTFLDTVVNLRRIITINSIIVEPLKKNQTDTLVVNPQLRLAVELTIYHLPGGSL